MFFLINFTCRNLKLKMYYDAIISYKSILFKLEHLGPAYGICYRNREKIIIRKLLYYDDSECEILILKHHIPVDSTNRSIPNTTLYRAY
ncbi:hypothetical protein BpHYR1_054009 [Brachionus plicatilis]|uniref:Uncharacterized protein n=1 Tax=Brachionus plicatilis TaxID=10195 RepID=A0A3M7PUU5_BRAPC|nr:hypothetical protein BpHYR1_054009 [Brachionus plicatilis]